MPEFSLHPQLAADCHPVGDMGLSRVLLFDDSRYPWVILVPRRVGLREVFELAAGDRRALLDESCRLGELMLRLFGGGKLNIAALGNLVPQLHLHHVLRVAGDAAWPGPVWGHSPASPYTTAKRLERVALLRTGLSIPAR
jgi:diadenosine tetraphosphate (Ap4A) HIT family hydrolase